ncbi:MAG TPA: dockerin [Polyangia bacterium]|jgi:hypothetical protein
MRAETNFTIWACAVALAGSALGCGGGGGGGHGNGDGGVTPLWLGVVGTGQSLSVGAASNGLVYTSPSASNLKLSLGARGTSWPIDANDPELSLAPLAEPIRPIDTGSSNPYPNNIYGESFHTAMASELTALHQAAAGQDLVTVHSVVGQGGASITIIGKGGTGNAYAASLFEVTALARLAAAAGARYEVGAVMLTHGEADAERPSYEDDIAALAAAYRQDLPPITGQTRAVPMILSQQHADPVTGRSTSTVAAWKLGVDYPGKIYCAGPKYQYAYASDHIHLVAGQYDRLGIKYAEVYDQVVVQGNDWQPLQPIDVSREGLTIDIRFHVPSPPLAWDEAFGAPHHFVHSAWANGRGFEVEDSTGEMTITDVTIDGDTIHIGLAAAPVTTATAPLVVRYAMTQDATVLAGGLVSGRFGQLHDSDPLVGVDAGEIDCNVTSGSTMVTAATAGAFLGRSAHDVVEDVAGAGLVANTAVTLAAASSVSLSQPWTGATGAARLRFRSNQWNYAVAFELTVPDAP